MMLIPVSRHPGHSKKVSVAVSRRRFGSARRRAATALEFAVISLFCVFPIFLGMVEIGRGIMVAELLAHAARIGCRTGIVPGKTTTDIQTAVNNFLPTVGITSDSVTVDVNDVPADASNAMSTDELTVVVSVPVSKVSWIPGTSYLNANISGQFTLRRE